MIYIFNRFGKSVVADALLSGRAVLRLSGDDPTLSLDALPEDWEILLIDDFQQMQSEMEGQTLCELIRSRPERRFVILSRGTVPGYLIAFQYTGLMTVLEADDLLFDREDVRKLFADRELRLRHGVYGRDPLGRPVSLPSVRGCGSLQAGRHLERRDQYGPAGGIPFLQRLRPA